MSMGFHVLLKEERLKAGLKQNQLAGKLGVSSAYMAKLEKGGNTPSPDFVSRLADVLNLDPVTLFLASLDEGKLPDTMKVPVQRLKEEHELLSQDEGFRRMIENLQILDEESRSKIVEIMNRILDLFLKNEKSGNHLINPLE